MICLLMVAALAAEVVPLYPGTKVAGEEITDPIAEGRDSTRVHNIRNPSIEVFLPPKEKATGAAMVIAPGGGHQFLSIDTEGYNVAKYLNSIGVAGFVLKYRLAREAGSTFTVTDAVHDAEQAIRLVRGRAAEWGIDAGRVGIIGFSAGGEVAVRAATDAEANGGHPDFEALIYPGVRAETVQITKEAPPTFLLCADNDKGPSVAVGELYVALKKAGVPAEVHVYGSGGHGFGIRENPKPMPIQMSWYLRLGDWMRDRGLLKKS